MNETTQISPIAAFNQADYSLKSKKYLETIEFLGNKRGFSEQNIADYISNGNKIYAAQFEFQNQIPKTERKRWKQLALAVSCEMSPWNLTEFRVDGITPIYYTISLNSFLKSHQFKEFCTINEIEKSASKSVSYDIFWQGIEQLIDLIPECIEILLAATTFDHLKIEKHSDIPPMFKKILKDYLHLKERIDKKHQLLLPVHWAISQEAAHFFLCRLKKVDESQIKVQIFDAAEEYYESRIDDFIPDYCSSYTIKKHSTLEQQIDEICDISAIYTDRIIEFLECSTSPCGSLAERCVDLYSHTLRNGKVSSQKHHTPLSVMQYHLGKNCVSASFRMLLYTLVEEAAEHSTSENLDYYEIKDLCFSFFESFKFYLAAKTHLL